MQTTDFATDFTWRDALDLCVEFNYADDPSVTLLAPGFDHTSPVAGCWYDRVLWLYRLLGTDYSRIQLEDAIAEANRYCGRIYFRSAGAVRGRR